MKFLILISIVCVSVFLNSDAEARKKKKFKGVIIVNQILKLDGTMTINGQPAPEYSGVKEGDLLETNPKSAAVVRIAGLGIFRLGPSTTFKILKFSNRNESRFELKSGELLSVIKRPGSHKIKMPHADISLHETVFMAKTDGADDHDHEIDLEVGKLKVENLFIKDSPETLSLNPVIPPKSDISKAELKAPPKDEEEVKSSPEVSRRESSDGSSNNTAGSNSAENGSANAAGAKDVINDRELIIAPQGAPKSIRITKQGFEVKDTKNSEITEHFKYVPDLESMYALP